MKARSALLALMGILASCESTTGTGDESRVAGRWEYHALQEAPAAVLRGNVSWESTRGAAFEGTVSFTETTPAGARLLSGTSAGQLHADTLAEFTVFVDAGPRLHIGLLSGDSIAGSWTGIAGGAGRGTFVLRRNGGR